MNETRILVVDDEEDLCEILKFNLENEGYEVDTANSAEEALKMDISSYHLILLDVMMGEISGFKMANMLKKDKKTAKVPIIFITAKDTENDTVTGFNLGADDYISKPFSLREVIARVKAVLRRTATAETERAPERLVYQSLVIDITKKKVSIDGEEVQLTKKEFEKILKDKVVSECGVTLDVASAEQIYRCMAMIVRQIMSDRQKQFQAKTLGEGKKQVYYLCMEFLMGRSLRTSLFNLGLNEVAEQVLADADIKIDTIYEQEPDAGLGNGGLGRLAACYLDGMATDCIPGTGYSILYEYGIFKQKIVDGWQQETADNWLPGGQVWIKSHPDQAQEIRFDGQAIETWEGGFHHVKYENYNSVIAVPNDMYVAGYGTQGVSKLRL